MTSVRAAVAERVGAPLKMRDLELDEPRAGEVRVRMVASGVCHTDAVVRDGMIPTPLPAVLGHEGAGVVEAVGPDVHGIAAGDHVVLSSNSCGACRRCLTGQQAYCEDLFNRNFVARRPDGTTAFTGQDGPVGSTFFGQSSFASVSNVAVRSLVKVSSGSDLTLLAPLGCGINTGAGTVLNEFRPGPGATIAVFGTGAVGCAAVMAAAVTAATTIIAVDVLPARLELAAELGATHTVDSREGDVAAQLRHATRGRGLDFAIDTTARPDVLRTAVDSLAVRGVAAEVGSAHAGTEVALETGASLNRGWTVKTVIQGSSVPQVFIPALIELWQQGRFPFDRLITHYPFEQIAAAFDDAESGRTIKPIVVY